MRDIITRKYQYSVFDMGNHKREKTIFLNEIFEKSQNGVRPVMEGTTTKMNAYLGHPSG